MAHRTICTLQLQGSGLSYSERFAFTNCGLTSSVAPLANTTCYDSVLVAYFLEIPPRCTATHVSRLGGVDSSSESDQRHAAVGYQLGNRPFAHGYC